MKYHILREFSSPYEEPTEPEIIIDSENFTVEQCVERLLKELNIKTH